MEMKPDEIVIRNYFGSNYVVWVKNELHVMMLSEAMTFEECKVYQKQLREQLEFAIRYCNN